MVACYKCVLSLICLLVNFQTIYGYFETDQNAIYGIQNDRAKRQAGYVYDKPSISFNLPSRNPIVSTSTQASPPVDRTSMQMYYAYPAPAEGNTVNIGFTSASSTVSTTPASLGVAGYNYAVQTTQTGSQGNIGDGGSGIAGANGYNYNVQNTQSAVGKIATGGTSVSSGYNYGIGSTAVQNTGMQNPRQQNVQVGSVGSIATGVTSGSSGYNYGVQNSGSQISTNAGSSGYSTQTSIQNSGASNNAESTGYSTQSSIQNSDARISIGGVSTNAPKYLPPSNSAAPSTVSTTSTPSPTVSVAAPSDSYLPPSISLQNTPAVTVTQTGSNVVPSVNVGTQTYIPPASVPNAGYLSPNTVSNVPNVQINRALTTAAPARQPQPQPTPTTNYLPPIMPTQGTVSTPAASYLPPVF